MHYVKIGRFKNVRDYTGNTPWVSTRTAFYLLGVGEFTAAQILRLIVDS